MDIFTEKKFLIRLVILLTALNLLSIGVFIWKDLSRKQPPPDRQDIKKDVTSILEKELSLSEKQSGEMKKLRAGFFEKEKVLREIIRSERDSMNSIMFSKATDDEQVKSLAKRIADNEYKMEMYRYEQAKEMKNICNTEQLEKFEKLVKEIRDYFKPDNQPERKNKPGE